MQYVIKRKLMVLPKKKLRMGYTLMNDAHFLST